MGIALLFVPKLHGTPRFFVDYRWLIQMTVGESYIVTQMNESIDFLGDTKTFSTLGSNCVYWHVKIDEMDKVSFTSKQGVCFKRMQIGIKNATATFQRAADVILGPLKWQILLVFLDDVILYSSIKEKITAIFVYS